MSSPNAFGLDPLTKQREKLGLRPLSKMPKTFEGLCRMLPPRPNHKETDYNNAIEMHDSIVGFDLNLDQEDYLAVLTTLVGAYENEHHAIGMSDATGLDALKYLLGQSDMTASDLGNLLGNRSLSSKILRGKRELSKIHLRILADRFKVDAGLFLQAFSGRGLAYFALVIGRKICLPAASEARTSSSAEMIDQVIGMPAPPLAAAMVLGAAAMSPRRGDSIKTF